MIKITNDTAVDIILTEIDKASIEIFKGLEEYKYKYFIGKVRRASLGFMRMYGNEHHDWFKELQSEHKMNHIKKFIEQSNINDNIDYLQVDVATNAMNFHIISDVYGIMEE